MYKKKSVEHIVNILPEEFILMIKTLVPDLPNKFSVKVKTWGGDGSKKEPGLELSWSSTEKY
jgi:hypothetical protein